MLKTFVLAFAATVSFGVLFQGPRRILWQGGIIGACGWILLVLLKESFYVHSFTANFAASLFIALCSETAARIFKQPATVFNVMAVIPIVPGLGIYRGMQCILEENSALGSKLLLGAAMDSCAIALGIMMISGVFFTVRKVKEANEKTEKTKL